MSLPRNTGTYLGTAKSWAVEQQPGKCPRWVVIFQLTHFLNNGQWEDVVGDIGLTGRFTLINKDGTDNEINCRAIVEAYELPAFDFKVLTDHDFTQPQVQVVVEDHEYNGKVTPEVRYLNHRDYQGRSVASDPVVVQDLNTKYGALLRQKYKPKTAGNGAAKPQPKPSAAATVLAPKTPEEAKLLAWREFSGKTMELTKEARAASFIETVTKYGHNDPKTLTVAQWETITNQIAEYGPYKEPEPVAETVPPTIADDDIPF